MASELAPSSTMEPAAGCTGAATIYNSSGLVVPFQNLCGKDISAPADFPEAFVEASFADCLARCVETKPLCYGFDFRPLGSGETNCWLKNITFDERTAVSRDFVADAAMLSSDFLGSMADECKELGLMGCFEKNGGWRKNPTTTSSNSGASSASSAMSSMTSSTAASSSTTAAPKSGLSTGASAGIGVGVGVVVLGAVVFGVTFLLRKRKQRARNVSASGGAVEVGPGEISTGHGYVREKSAVPTELYAQHNYHHAAELEGAGPQTQSAQFGVGR
jgi:hypothetical protein